MTFIMSGYSVTLPSSGHPGGGEHWRGDRIQSPTGVRFNSWKGGVQVEQTAFSDDSGESRGLINMLFAKIYVCAKTQAEKLKNKL